MLGAKGSEVSLRKSPNSVAEYVIPEATEDRVPHFPVPKPMQQSDSVKPGSSAGGAGHSISASSLSSSPSRNHDAEVSGSEDDKRDRLLGHNDVAYSSSGKPGVDGSERGGTANGAGRSTDELGKMLAAASQRVGMLNGLLSGS
jgi:hypothetical protein